MSKERSGRTKYNFLPNAMAAAIHARWGVKRTGNIVSKKSNPVKKRKTKESEMVLSTQAFPKLTTPKERIPKQRKTSKQKTFVSLSQPDLSTRKYISKNWQPPLKSMTIDDKKDFENKTSTMLEEKSENDNSIKAVNWTQHLKSSLLSEIPCSMPDPIMQNDLDDSFSERLTQEYIPKNAEKSPPYLSQDMMKDESPVIDKITNNPKISQEIEQNYEIISNSLDKNTDQTLENNVTLQKGINAENLCAQHTGVLQTSHDANTRTEQATQKQSIYNEDDDELIMSSQPTINSHLIPTIIPQTEKIIENSIINDNYNSLQEMTITNSLNRISNNAHLDNESIQINVLNQNKEENIIINFPQALQHLSEQSCHADDVKNIVNKESPVIKNVKDNATDSNSNTSELISCISGNDKNQTLNFTIKDLSQNLETKTEEIMSCVMENSTRLTSNTKNGTEENMDINEKSDTENKELYSSQRIRNSQSTEKINKQNSQDGLHDWKIMQNTEGNQRVNIQNTDKITSDSEPMNNINNICLPELIVNQNINCFSLQSKETNTSQQVISAYISCTSVSVEDNPIVSRDTNINESKFTVNMVSNPNTVQPITNQAVSLSVEDDPFVSRDANLNKSKITVNISNPNTVKSMITNQDASLQISNNPASNTNDEQQTAQNNDTERSLKKNQYSDSNVENSKITKPHNIFETLNNSIAELENKLKKYEHQKNVLQEINAPGTNVPQLTVEMNTKSNSEPLKNQNGPPELEKNIDFTDTIQHKCLKKIDSKILYCKNDTDSYKEMPQENQSYNNRFEPHIQNKTLDQNLNFQEKREEINLNSNENNPLTKRKQNAATTSEKQTKFHKTAEEKQSISVSNNSSEHSVSLKQISNSKNVQIQSTLKQLKENNLNNLMESFCKSPTKANEAPNIQQEAWEQSVSNENLLDDDLGITHSQLLRIEDECLLNAHNEAAVPVDWMQKMVESREKLQAVILEIKRLNALITRVRREMWHP